MSHVLFVTWDGGGNVPPALEIAAELQRRGDTVRFLGHPQQRASIEERGFVFEAYRTARPWSVLEARSGPLAGAAFVNVFTDRGMGTDLLESLKREPVDQLVIDGLLMGAVGAAHKAGIRYSVLVHTLYSVMIGALTRGPLAAMMRAKGFNPRRLYDAADRILVTTLADLDPAAASAPERVRYTGPLVSAVASSPSSPPVVLASLSTTYIEGQQEALQAILDAVDGMPVQAIVTTGPAVEPSSLSAPANATVHQFVPHADLMPTASVVVGHGGHATTMLALAHGLPLLVMPMNPRFDQPAIGALIASSGAGLTLEKTASAAAIREALERLLGDESYTTVARELGAKIRGQNAAAVAADVLAEVLVAVSRRR
jgi:UDP:flavonoid glycosyltransferase YjiC (YdhE family)